MKHSVMIVDDSVLMRKLLKEIIEESDKLEVVATATDGLDALDKFREYQPDIVTLDIEMPKMNGIICLEQLLKIKPVPVIIISAYSKKGSSVSVKALELGAFDIIEKPSGSVSLDIAGKAQEIVKKLENAVSIDIEKLTEPPKIKLPPVKAPVIVQRPAKRLVAIASSTGGPKTLMHIIPYLDPGIECAYAVVQHMPEGFTRSFANRLNSLSQINIFEAETGQKLNNGDCVIAKGGWHLIFNEKGIVELDDSPPYHSVKPSADIMMLSAVRYFKNRIIGIVLTGMGKDGSEGVKMIKMSGGYNIAESEKSAVIYGMPKYAVKTGDVDIVADKQSIAEKIEELINALG